MLTFILYIYSIKSRIFQSLCFKIVFQVLDSRHLFNKPIINLFDLQNDFGGQGCKSKLFLEKIRIKNRYLYTFVVGLTKRLFIESFTKLVP